MSMLEGLDRWWFCPAPALRLAVLRVLIISFSLLWLIGVGPLIVSSLRFDASHFDPIGVVGILDSPLSFALGIGLWLATIALGLAALLGWRFRLTGPVFALGLLWVTSYRNSWGMVFHSENLMVMHTLILAMLPASDAWSLDARRRGTPAAEAYLLDPRYGWGPKLMATLTALTYVLAGVAKLRNAGEAWLGGDVLLAQVAWDNLRKIELGAAHSPIGAALSSFPVLFPPLAWASMVLELGAPLALVGRRLAWIWTLGIWSFHLGIALIMAILFAYPVSGVAFAPLFAVEVLPLRLAATLRRRRPDSKLASLLPEEPPCPSA